MKIYCFRFGKSGLRNAKQFEMCDTCMHEMFKIGAECKTLAGDGEMESCGRRGCDPDAKESAPAPDAPPEQDGVHAAWTAASIHIPETPPPNCPLERMRIERVVLTGRLERLDAGIRALERSSSLLAVLRAL